MLKFFLVLLLSTFLSSNESKKIKIETLLKSTSSWDGTLLKKYPKGEAEITILKVIIPAHTKFPLHKHPFISAGILLSGELTIVTDSGTKLLLKSGEPAIELIDTWHYGENNGNIDAELIVFYAGIKGKAISILK